MSLSDPVLNPILAQGVMEGIVALVLAEHEGQRAAQAICSFAETAHFPASLWISLGKSAHIHSVIESAGRFSLAVLSEKQTALARSFGTESGGNHEDVARLSLESFNDGFLVLNGALATTACEVKETVDLGSETMFLAEILSTQLDSRVGHQTQLLTTEMDRS